MAVGGFNFENFDIPSFLKTPAVIYAGVVSGCAALAGFGLSIDHFMERRREKEDERVQKFRASLTHESIENPSPTYLQDTMAALSIFRALEQTNEPRPPETA